MKVKNSLSVDINKLTEPINVGSIFCGCGGFDTGLKRVGFKTAWSMDIMSEACQSFKANHKGTRVFCGDVHTVEDFSKGGKIKGLVFGPPCQGFSRANLGRTMKDPRNFAYLATLKAVSQCDVEFFIFENVVGLLDMQFADNSSVFEKIRSDYENCGRGYNVAWQVIDCSTVGVPQANRLRLIMVGFRKDLGVTYKFMPLTHGEGRFMPIVTQRDAIGHLENVDQKGDYYEGPYDHKFLSRCRQKSWDEPGYTVEASARYAKVYPGLGKMFKSGYNNWVIPKECRRLSLRESLLLQTFPEDYILKGDMEHKYTMIGNAVPPRLAEFIGKPIAFYYINGKEALLDAYKDFKEDNLLHEEKAKKVAYQKQLILKKLQMDPFSAFYKNLLRWVNEGNELSENQMKHVI